MALTTQKKSVITFQKIKKAVKSALKKSFFAITGKHTKIQKPELDRVDFDIEINENIQNEALEARLRQIIDASPASLDLENDPVYRKGVILLDEHAQVQFGTFWTGGDKEDLWDLCPHLCSFNSNMKVRQSPSKSSDHRSST